MASTPPSADTEEEEFGVVSKKPKKKPEEPKLRRKAVCEAEVRTFMFLSVLISCLHYFLFVLLSEPTDFKIGWLGMFACFELADRFLKSVGWKSFVQNRSAILKTYCFCPCV